jgi:hypothetical protein
MSAGGSPSPLWTSPRVRAGVEQAAQILSTWQGVAACSCVARPAHVAQPIRRRGEVA